MQDMVKDDRGQAAGADELQHVSDRMLGNVEAASLAHEAVLGVEMGLLRQGWPVGQSLGALPDVRKRLGLGRPAFREAVTILEARGLLDVRRGPGGGLFVAAPALEDVVGAVVMFLALGGETHACIEEFRLLVWRAIVHVAIERDAALPTCAANSGEWGFAADIAAQSGKPTLALLARLAEMLVRISHGRPAPAHDAEIEAAIRQRDLSAAFAHLDAMAGAADRNAPVVALEVAERAFSLSGRKSAMALAARLTRELSEGTGTQEAEWETAERLGYTDNVVRQARRILQDFGIVRCRKGRKGAELAPPAAPTGVIRLLAPCLVASATPALDLRESIAFLVSSAPVLAARRVHDAAAASGKLWAGGDAFEALTIENHLLELSGNPLLAIIVRSLGLANIFVGSEPLVPPDRGDVVAITRRILDAVENGDVVAAGRLARMKLDVMRRPAECYLAVA